MPTMQHLLHQQLATAEQNAKDYADANDANTTYTAGNGLTLTGTEFTMSGNYLVALQQLVTLLLIQMIA